MKQGKESFNISNIKLVLVIFCVVLASCEEPMKTTSTEEPLFINSIVSTDIDFIKSSDADAFVSLTYIGQEDKEMPDSRNNNLFDTNTFVFEANFSNGKIVEIWAHSTFGSKTEAQTYVDKLTSRLGKLPEFMRDELSHVVLHKGDAGAFSDAEGHFIILYSDNMDTRISNNDLEETVFHETVHASLDAAYANSEIWKQAQASDAGFITQYGEEYPIREDLAETALFAYTLIKNPNRLTSDTKDWMNKNIPNRLEVCQTIFN